jgi:hypothetical protein
MKSRNIRIIIALSAFFLSTSTALNVQWKYLPAQRSVPDHPRLLLLKGEEETIKKNIAGDPTWARLNLAIIGEADKMLALPELQRIQTGLRLLFVSREALRRIFYLSYAYRMTGSTPYALKAEKEMLAIAEFSDWNPSHFLDVAEMTMAMSIGYDWLHAFLSPPSRTAIALAIFQKGINPSMNSKAPWYKASKNNWNQVCNAGIAFGAIALFESMPQTARSVIDEALETINLPMKEYEPDGAYPEGFDYWDYGTSFNVLFLDAVEKVYGSAFVLDSHPAFMKTAAYRLHMTGPANLAFNYSDNGETGSLNPTMFWFAARSGNASLLWHEKRHLAGEASVADRILPAIMIWGSHIKTSTVEPPEDLFWTGGGITPAALMRASWTDTSAVFVGVKGGTASSAHAHMDAGSFVVDADGVRWASDFGMQDYNSLESKGVDLWNRAQNSDRWQIFRYNNRAHNTLTVDNRLHNAGGFAPIVSSSDQPLFMNAIVDLKDIFAPRLAAARRGVAIVNRQYVVVRDEVSAPAQRSAAIRWTMLTTAEATISGPNSFDLRKDGRKMRIEVTEPALINLKTWTTVPPNSFDAPNPGSTLIGFETTLDPGTSAVLLVKLIPQSAGKAAEAVPPLAQWPQ